MRGKDAFEYPPATAIRQKILGFNARTFLGPLLVLWLPVFWTFCLQAQTNLAFTKVRMDTNGLFLQWDGAYPPYVLERTATPAIPDSWLPVPIYTNDNACKLDSFSTQGFYRVRGVTNPPWGTYLGQWRVWEGEAQEYFAPHRLKSLWDLYEPPGAALPTTPANYFQSLIIRLQQTDGADLSTRISILAAFPNATVQISNTTLIATWCTGSGAARKDYTLEMAFPYPLTTPRPTILISDPLITFSCAYAAPQLALFREEVTTLSATANDKVMLVQLSETFDGFYPTQRQVNVLANSIKVNSSFAIGVPLSRGTTPIITATYPLVRWYTTSVTGLSQDGFTLQDRFSQTYLPQRHNWAEVILLEPVMEPGISPVVLDDLREANIRFIFANPSIIQAISFDGNLRTLWRNGQ